MKNNFITKEEINVERTSSNLISWVQQKLQVISSQKDGRYAIRNRKGLCKQFIEEIYPLSILASFEFPDRDDITFIPVLGNQNYDALINYNFSNYKFSVRLEITQAQGNNDYLRSEMINIYGRCPLNSKINIKNAGTQNAGRKLEEESQKVIVRDVQDSFNDQIQLIDEALERKFQKIYEKNTALLIMFDDLITSYLDESESKLQNFINTKTWIPNKFSTLYLVGRHRRIFMKTEY
jgi:hypothetical protein